MEAGHRALATIRLSRVASTTAATQSRQSGSKAANRNQHQKTAPIDSEGDHQGTTTSRLLPGRAHDPYLNNTPASWSATLRGAGSSARLENDPGAVDQCHVPITIYSRSVGAGQTMAWRRGCIRAYASPGPTPRPRFDGWRSRLASQNDGHRHEESIFEGKGRGRPRPSDDMKARTHSTASTVR